MNTSKSTIYSNRIEKFSDLLSNTNKQHSIISWLRLIIFCATIISWFYVITIHIITGIALGISGIIGFVIFLKKHKKLEDLKTYLETILTVNNNEYLCCKGTFDQFDGGNEFIDHSHPYSFDIDLFGNGSLFQYLNRTITDKGKKLLSYWLANTPLDNNTIQLHQEAIKELSNEIDFRQEFITAGKIFKSNAEEQSIVNDWLMLKPFFKHPFLINIILWFIPIITVAAIGGIVYGIFSSTLLIPIIIVNLGIVGSRIRTFNLHYQKLSNSHTILKKISKLITQIENHSFKSEKLQEIQLAFIENNSYASTEINKLTALLNNIDIRNNILAGTLLNILVLWDWQYLYRIEKWQKKHNPDFTKWLNAIGELDALLSLSNLHFNNTEYTFPKIVDSEDFVFKAENLGHPLIKSKIRICNNFEINSNNRYAIITGANMAGKSTFLRTIATNLVLGGCGAPVCAKVLTFSPLPLYSSMRAEDSLMNNESYFFAELKRLQKITHELDKEKKLFIILDEILRGTNSEDKRKGSIGFVKKITQKLAHGLVATHDLELARLAEQQPDTFKVCCFEVEIKNNELQFDYKLRNGITQNMNASFLMEKMGIIDKQ